jgi:GNAT superfamily N-acetyltransferase
MSTLIQWPRVEVHLEPEMDWTITDIPFPLFNLILRAQLPSENIETAIQARIAEGKSRNVPLLWQVWPSTQPSNLGEHLVKHGFILAEHAPGMAVELADLKGDLPTPPGFRIEKVNDPIETRRWWQVCGECFDMPDFAVEAFYDWMTCSDFPTIRTYMGFLNGRPVATSLLILGAGVAGIYNVATVPEARRQGIGALMTALPLKEALAEGYTIGVLEATEMGLGVYESLGFKKYCYVDQYVWLPQS